MKSFIALCIGGALAFTGSTRAAENEKALETEQEKASYGIGMNVAKRFKHDFIELDLEAFYRGFRDVLKDAKPAVTEAEVEAALGKLRTQVQERAAQVGTQNKKEADDFLAKNKDAKDVQSLPSGLQFQTLKEGTGPNPKASDVVKVHYRGTLLNGTEFDSSYKRNEPAVFPLEQVIPGWTEGIQKMKVGGKTKFWIPPHLAYGEQGQPPIPPNSLLVFEVELLGIESGGAPAPGQ